MGRLLSCLSPLALLLALLCPAHAQVSAPVSAIPAGPVDLKVRSLNPGLALQRLENGRITTLCVPPCQRQLHSGDLLRVTGLRRLRPTLFVLRVPGDHSAELVVSRSYGGALAYTLTGVGLLGVSAALWGVGSSLGNPDGQHAAYGTGAAIGAIGLGLTIYGIVLFARPYARVRLLRDLGPIAALQP